MINKLKKSKAGFTLVELIVVIAIIGVLAAVLAPQYIKYVETSREAVDENARDEIAHAVEIAILNEKVYKQLPTSAFSVTCTDAGDDSTSTFTATYGADASAGTIAALVTELEGSITKVDFKSKKYGGKTLTIQFNYTAGDTDNPARYTRGTSTWA